MSWYAAHKDSRKLGERVADMVAAGMGSWSFIIIQTLFVIGWMVANVVALVQHWDPYPFILLNLLFSTQAAYAAPIIMQSQNRHSERDRHQADFDHKALIESKKEIEELIKTLNRIESEKLDEILKRI